MTVTEFAAQAVTTLILSFAGSGFVVWLTKQWISEKMKNSIKSEYDLRIESHKAQLKAEADVELEKLRSRLSLEAREHDVVFSKLHEKRGEVIADIYAKLKRVRHSLEEYVKAFEFSGEKPRRERGEELFNVHKEFFDAFNCNAIFLPESAAKEIDDLNRLVVLSGNEFSILVMDDNYPDRHKKWVEINERVENILPKALSKLEKELRSLLGYKSEALDV